MIIDGKIFRSRMGKSVRFQEHPPRFPEPRPLRIARTLALAHKLRELLDNGEAGSLAELAGIIKLSRPRVTQLINLTFLAPDIQEEILFMEVSAGRDPISEHDLRRVLRSVDWQAHRRIWEKIKASRVGAQKE